MKLWLTVYLGILTLIIVSCAGENPLTGDRITYEEALALQNLEFVIDGREVNASQELGSYKEYIERVQSRHTLL